VAKKTRHLLAVILAMIFAGLIGYNMRIIGTSVPIVSVLFSRLLIGTALVAIIIPFFDKKVFKVGKKKLFRFALVGALMASAFGFYLWALSLAPVANVTLIVSTNVIFAVIFAYLFLKEKVTRTLLISMVIAVVGLGIMNTFQGGFLFGSIVALFQAMLFGTFVGAIRLVERHGRVGAIFWFLFFAALFSLPFALWKGFGDLGNHVQEIAIIGIFGTGLSYTLLVYGVRKVHAVVAAMITLTVLPVSSILFAAFFIGEIPSARTIVGGIVLLFAGAYLLLKERVSEWNILHH